MEHINSVILTNETIRQILNMLIYNSENGNNQNSISCVISKRSDLLLLKVNDGFQKNLLTMWDMWEPEMENLGFPCLSINPSTKNNYNIHLRFEKTEMTTNVPHESIIITLDNLLTNNVLEFQHANSSIPIIKQRDITQTLMLSSQSGRLFAPLCSHCSSRNAHYKCCEKRCDYKYICPVCEPLHRPNHKFIT